MSKDTKLKAIRVTPYGDDGYTFLASSRSRKGDHMVDISCYKNLGACACEDFRLRLLPIFRVSQEVSDELRCDHIIACREYRLNDIIDRLKRREKLPPAAEGKISLKEIQNQARLGPSKEGRFYLP